MRNQNDREEAIFQAALELARPEQRAEYLSKACGTDEGLRRRVASLLQAHDQAGEFLAKPATGSRLAAAAVTVKLSGQNPATAARPVTEKPGDFIGRYRLLQKVGEGGCGVVYMAEQEEPVRRRVALKIIKVGMDTRQVIARFEAERQALAMMDHPNIARVLDAGATETGRPYFVMDLVRGIRITEYCDQSNLSTEERLELFKQVCHAIQHAHQKGIIHRDIKPSNILVTLHDGVPVPVIIDFGIAKATERRLTEKTLFTAFEQFIGTPAYMSPEQAEMSRLDIDTRSDIYSLGVLLYELLTGRTPFDAQTLLQAGLEQMRRTIREQEPLRPSTCLSTMAEADLTNLAKHHNAEPLRLINRLRGDLDWIVMKCLEKDRTRRYETANGLALDIERYLRDEPVLARPPSKLYRLQKLARRNQAAFVAASLVAVALVIGLGVSTLLYMREREAYRRAVLAERNQSRLRREAELAQASEAEERHHSELTARQSRLNSYAADIYSAFLARESGNLGRAMDLLEHQIPQPGEEDLRGFEWRFLWQQAQGDEVASFKHEALVSCAVLSPTSQTLATASYDGALRVWDMASKQVVKSFPGFDQQFGWRYIAYSPDGQWLAGVRQGKLTVWDCRQSDYPVRFEEESSAQVIAFTPDGARLIGWGKAGLVVVETGTWQSVTLRTKLRPVQFPSLAIDRTGQLVAVAHERDHAIEVWDLETRALARYLEFKDDGQMAFVSVAWSPDGLLAGATWGGRLSLIDGRSGQELTSTQAHAGCVFGLAFAPDGKLLATAGHDQLIHLWKVPQPEEPPQLELAATLRGHRDEIWSLAFSSDGRLLCTAGKDGTAKLWNPAPRPEPVYLSDWYDRAFSADGKLLVTLSSEPAAPISLDLWDVDNPGVRTVKTLPITDLTNVVRAVLSSDARLMGVGKNDGTVEIWNLDSGKLARSGRVSSPALTAMSFSGNGRTLVLGMDNGTVELWNLRTGQSTRLGKSGAGRITSVQFTPANHFLRARVLGRPAELVWDLKAGAQLPLPLGSMDPAMMPFAISPDDKTLAVAGTNYVVQLWDLPSLRERAILRGHRWTINCLAFSPDGRLLATGGLDAVTRVWDVSTGTEVTRPLHGHLQGVSDLAFSPDGKVLATGSTDSTVKIWHVATGRELFGASDASQPVFSQDGNTLLFRTSRGARLFHVPTLAEIDAARRNDRPD